MAKLQVTGFKGRRPAVDNAMLDNESATVATNCRIEGGHIKPLYDPLQTIAKTTGGALKSIYYYRPGDDWLEWETDVDVVTAQIGQDAYDRVIYTGDTGGPKQSWNAIITTGGAPYPGTSFLLGVPPPGYNVSSAPLGIAIGAVIAGTADDPSDTVDSRYYVITTVDSLGAEGPPSPVSDEVEWRPGQTVTLTIPAIPAGNYPITVSGGSYPASYRIYRTSTGSQSTEFLFVMEGSANWGGTESDTTAAAALSEALPTEIYDLPSDEMIGITAMPGGYLAGHFDSVLCFSEPAQPHAWPVQYQINTKTDIVGISTLDDNALLVTTKDRPYIAAGVDPASMTLTELPIKQSCTSKRSMADVGIGVVYSSPDGLVLASRNGTGVITTGIFTREQWQALTPTSIEGWAWEGLYICFHATGGFIINPAQPEAGIVDLDNTYAGAYHDPVDDTLYVVDGANIKQWDAGSTYMQFTWKGKVHEMIRPTSLGVAQLLGDTTDEFTLNVYADGDLHKAYSRKEGAPFKLRGGYKARKIQLEIVSSTATTGGSLHAIRAATTMEELNK